MPNRMRPHVEYLTLVRIFFLLFWWFQTRGGPRLSLLPCEVHCRRIAGWANPIDRNTLW
jgi:hypothetical protein